MKIKTTFAVFILCLFVISGCQSSNVQKTQDTFKTPPEESSKVRKTHDTFKITLPKDIPSFVKEKDFENIDFNKSVTVFDTGTRNDMVGNKNKIGFIGPDLNSNGEPDFKANETQKWLWHFWGVNKGDLTIVGYNADTLKITPVLGDGWSRKNGIGGGKIEGADSSMPSHVTFPEAGRWALLVYIDGKLFDTLVMDVKGE
ncbi:hypothetical protein [Neobacillus sp. NPDC093127]|uniref:hypothetical protein n=1 Tax=Neobacillus sp. NPDC093127 TaxID=3364296 RepID=UPI00380DAFD0